MPRLCELDGCDKPHKARGFCGTHYNQQLPNRHPKVTLTCDACGGPAIKESRARRYVNVFCSELCRDFHRWGPLSSELPKMHMARWVGKTSQWFPPSKALPAMRPYVCDWCGTEGESVQPAKTYCSPYCAKRSAKVRRRGREHEAHGTYTWTQVVRLWAAFDRRCAYCMEPTPLAEIQPEHVIPLSRGGANNIGNLLPSCAPCNSDKRDLMLNEWNEDRTQRGLPTRVTTWTAGDARYSHLAAVTPLGLAA